MSLSPTTAPFWRKVGALCATLGVLLLASCGGGGGGEPAPPPPTTVRGFANHGQTCAISSVLQVLMHDPELRRTAHAALPEAKLESLHAAYADASTDHGAFDTLYRNTTLAFIQQRHAPVGQPGSALDVTQLWEDTAYGLNLPLSFVTSIDEIAALRAKGERVIGFVLFDKEPEVGDLPTGYASFTDLPDPDQLSALVVNTGGHFVTYAHIDSQWWELSDASMARVDTAQLQDLVACGRQGIVFAVYRH